MKYVTRYAGSVFFFFLNTKICVVNSGKNRVFVCSFCFTDCSLPAWPICRFYKTKYAEMRSKKRKNNIYRMRS